MRHHALKVARAYGDVGVVDEDIFATCLRHKLDEGTDLAVGTEALRAFDEADGALGKFAFELPHGGNGGVIESRDAKENFVSARISLAAVRAKRIEHAGVDALQRLENGDTGHKGREWSTPGNEKHSRCSNGREEVAHSCHGQDRGESLHGQGDCVGVHGS